jgi:hypothetical protein
MYSAYLGHFNTFLQIGPTHAWSFGLGLAVRWLLLFQGSTVNIGLVSGLQIISFHTCWISA